MIRQVATLLLLAAAGTSFAAERSVLLVNQTGSALSDLSVRQSGGGAWKQVVPGLSLGARTSVSIDVEGGCAYDLRAKLAGGAEATWNNLNFCETRSVSLNRRTDGLAWADYD